MRAFVRKPTLAENGPETQVRRSPSPTHNTPENIQSSVCACDGGCPRCEGKRFRALRFQGDEKLQEILDGKRTLRKEGLPRGNDVGKIQQALVDHGYHLPVYGVDGIFGPETERAVKSFQHDFGVLNVDGRVGSITMETLDDITYGEEKRQFKKNLPMDNDVSSFDDHDPQFVGAGSPQRREFEKAVKAKDWKKAYKYLNGLSMSEMLKAMDDLPLRTFNEMWDQRANYKWMVNLPRIQYARDVVLQGALPRKAPSDLEAGCKGKNANKNSCQIKNAADFLAERLMGTAGKIKVKKIDPKSDPHISLILMECHREGVTDRSHIAYILATAHWESRMGADMTEKCGKCKKYEIEPKKTELGNTNKGDGWWFRGRGYVQLTGRKNYRKFSTILGIDLEGKKNTKNINKAAEPKYAAEIIVYGMKNGNLTGKKLADFGTDKTFNFEKARAIIDGKSKLRVTLNVKNIAKRYRDGMNPNP